MLKRLDPDSGNRHHAHSAALCNWRMQGWVEGRGPEHHEVYEEAKKGIRVLGHQDEEWSRCDQGKLPGHLQHMHVRLPSEGRSPGAMFICLCNTQRFVHKRGVIQISSPEK